MSEQRDRDRARLITRISAEHDQDWEACKAWWREESVAGRLQIVEAIKTEHADPYIERMSRMALLTLDRLVLEVWPGPQAKKEPQP